MIVIVGGTIEDWGLIPAFLDDNDPRPAREQFNARYIAGWQPFDGFTMNPETYVLSYTGDPPLEPLSTLLFRHEVILIYPYSWVAIVQPDGAWEVCRMD
jgi:hypothetical protein